MHWVIASLTKRSMGYNGLPYNYEGNISEKGSCAHSSVFPALFVIPLVSKYCQQSAMSHLKSNEEGA